MLENKKRLEVKWSSNIYKLSEFLDKFSLPQTVRVAEGIHNEDESFSIDDILVFHDHVNILKVKAKDMFGEVEPLSCKVKVLRVQPEFAHYRLSGREILLTLSKVKFLRVCNDDPDIGLRRNEVFSINYNSVQNQGESFSFRINLCQDHERGFKIDEKCNTKFQPVLDPEEYFISDVVKRFGLPQYVSLAANSRPETKQRSSESSNKETEQVLKLESSFIDNSVTASNSAESNTTFKLRGDLDLLVCPTLEAEYRKNSISRRRSLNVEVINSKFKNTVSKECNEDRDVYEDMANMALDKNNSLPRYQVQPESGQRQNEGRRVRNAYTPTPSAIAMKPYIDSLITRSRAQESGPVVSSPKASQRKQKNRDRESWYDVPKRHETPQCQTGNEAPRSVVTNTQLDNDLIQLRPQLDDENNHAEPIYQEIDEDFREQLEKGETITSLKSSESQGTSQTGNTSNTSFHSAIRKSCALKAAKKWGLKKKDEIIGKKDKLTESNQSELQVKSSSQAPCKSSLDNLVQDSKNHKGEELQETTGLECSNDSAISMTSQQRLRNSSPSKRSLSVGSLETNSITDALLKNKLFAFKSDSKEGPPLPPPRTSSWKPENANRSSAASAAVPGRLKQNNPPATPVRKSQSMYETASKPIVHNSKLLQEKPTPRARGVGTTTPNTKPATTNCAEKADSELYELPVSESRKILPENKTGAQAKHPVHSKHLNLSRSKSQMDFGFKNATLTNTVAVRPMNVQKPDIPTRKSSVTAEGKAPPFHKNPVLKTRGIPTTSSTLPRKSSSTKLRETTKSDFVIPDDLSSLGISGVSDCLRQINMEYLVEIFEENLIDGEMLLSLDDEMMQDMGFEKFHRVKLQKFIKGWRPCL